MKTKLNKKVTLRDMIKLLKSLGMKEIKRITLQEDHVLVEWN